MKIVLKHMRKRMQSTHIADLRNKLYREEQFAI